MDYILELHDVAKSYDDFSLEKVNFSLEKGCVMGLIGTNGAGKTTLIHIMLGLIKKYTGTVKIFGMDIREHEREVKDLCGFILDDNPFIENISAKSNARIFGPYYSKWDEEKFFSYCEKFQINVKKPIKKLSQGTIIKLQLAFALSHDAKLFIFDEPSAGLDPVFRRELIDIMYDLLIDGERSILFSTHLTNDLDGIADYLTMIHNGNQLFSMTKEDLTSNYQLVRGSKEEVDTLPKNVIVGQKDAAVYSEALVHLSKGELEDYSCVLQPTIEDIMYYMVDGELV